MEPFAREGDFVLAIPFLKSKVGDVVIAKYHGKFLLKRIRRISGEKFWLEGDNTYQSTDSRNFGWLRPNRGLWKTLLVHKTGA